MKQIFISALCLAALTLGAQESQQISTGAGYNKQSYVSLAAGTEHQVANTAWDIAFTVAPADAGVFINESVGSAPDAFPIQAYFPYLEDFSMVPDSAIFAEYALWNRESSWTHGAVNEFREGSDPNDFGWGTYNPVTQEIIGAYVFVIQLRDGTYLKLQIQSLINGVYTFRYANLDGSGEVTKTISKTDHTGKILAYFSFANGETVDVEPAGGFDLIFCRYIALLEAGGDSVPYIVTGILSAAGIEVAQADFVDPDTVHFEDFVDSLSSHPEVIGHDWKFFDLGNFVWVLTQDRVYFVKTRDEHIWKLQLVQFAGSGSGNAVFEKTDLGLFSAVEDPSSPFSEFKVYPNPAVNEVNVLYAMKNHSSAAVKFQLFDSSGRFVDQYSINAGEGLNVFTIRRDDLVSGMYYMRLMVGEQAFMATMQINR